MNKPDTFGTVTEDDVIAALEGGSFGNWPQDPAALLEFFHRMLDLKWRQARRYEAFASNSAVHVVGSGTVLLYQ